MQWVVTSEAPSGYCDFYVVARGYFLAHAVSHVEPSYNTGLQGPQGGRETLLMLTTEHSYLGSNPQAAMKLKNICIT